MGKELLLEIGTEEIPAAFLPKALADMEAIIGKALSEERIPFGAVETMGTPRRLVLAVSDMAETQEDEIQEKLGPAKRVAFDAEGKPTKAALGFARGQGLDMSELGTAVTDKGEYLVARKKISGKPTKEILSALLPRFIASIPFRKSMRWMNLEMRFARPVHWIVALYGGEVVPFRMENIQSGNRSRGHRFMAPEPFEVKGLADYLEKTRERFVIVKPGERRALLLEGARKEAAAVSGTVLRNDDLLEEVTFLVEYPSALRGTFEEEYLKLPREVLVTTMTKHQKYFPVVNGRGDLLPHFITISNTAAVDSSVVARGNEKVIRARLADARFFFEEDRKAPLESYLDELKNVVFHSQLGTSYEKVMQFRELARYITGKVKPEAAGTVDRTALLAKADLETRMVYEFTELQGVMGREYALLSGEDPVVAKAVYEHYLPVAAGGSLPETDEGAIVSIADKMDTIAGFFGIGLVPSGTADPYALRRQALGIINIILNRAYPLDLEDLLEKSLDILGGKVARPRADVKKEVLDFFRGRFENQLVSQGHPQDVVVAVLSRNASDLLRSVRKIEAVEKFKTHKDFEPLVVAFKRVVNILKDFQGGPVDPALFEGPEEKNLHETFLALRDRAVALIGGDRHEEALVEMARLRAPVDAFFETVLVMAKDERVRFNRLSLLAGLAGLFYQVADFSKIVTER
jgi:glycyl-tRNA synthetase beta chain